MKKNGSGKHVKRSLLDGVDNFRLVQRQMKVQKPNYKPELRHIPHQTVKISVVCVHI